MRVWVYIKIYNLMKLNKFKYKKKVYNKYTPKPTIGLEPITC